MRTQRQCLAKAAEMIRIAGTCKAPEAKAEFLSLARIWEIVAIEAAWQDARGAPESDATVCP